MCECARVNAKFVRHESRKSARANHRLPMKATSAREYSGSLEFARIQVESACANHNRCALASMRCAQTSFEFQNSIRMGCCVRCVQTNAIAPKKKPTQHTTTRPLMSLSHRLSGANAPTTQTPQHIPKRTQTDVSHPPKAHRMQTPHTPPKAQPLPTG